MKKFKKLLSAAIAVMMLSQTCMFAGLAHAEGGLTIAPADLCTTKEGLVPGYTLKLTGAADGAEIVWEVSNAENGTYTPISDANQTEYTLLNTQENRWIRAKAGEEVSNSLKVGAAAGYFANYYLWDKADAQETGPAQYRFSVGGTPYVLLDEKTVGGEKQYLVYRAKTLGKTAFDDNKTTRKFDPAVQGNIAYKLNNEGEKLYKGIEDDIKKYAQRSDWVTLKGGGSATDIKNNYVVYAKFAILDSHELTDWTADGTKGKGGYSVRLGYRDLYPADGTDDRSWLRDPHSTSNNRYIRDRSGLNQRAYSTGVSSGDGNVYPICWISGDFFKNVRVNSGGADVMAAVKDETSGDDQYATLVKLGYSAAEIKAMGVTVPEDVTVTLSGTAKPGYTLTVVDNTGKAVTDEVVWSYEDGTVLSANTEAVEKDTYTVGKAVGSYTVKEADQGRRIKATVTVSGTKYELISDAVSAPLADLKTGLVPGTAAKADANYCFTLKNGTNGTNNYMLLDTVVENGQKKHMIIALDSYAYSMWDLDQNQKFDPNNNRNIAYLLNEVILKGEGSENNGLADASSVKYLPEMWKTYVLDNLWLTEGGSASDETGLKVGTEDYLTKAKVAILSYNELVKYADIYGMNTSIWLRSPADPNWTNKGYGVRVSGDGKVWADSAMNDTSRKFYVRPVFYVSDAFFKEVALNTEDMGAAVRTAVKNAIGEEWAATELYTVEEKAVIDAPFIKFGGLYSGETELKNTTKDGVTTSTFTGQTQATSKYYMGNVNNSSAVLIIAVYEDDVLKGVAKRDVSLEAGKPVKESVTVSGFEPATEHTSIKAFVWDSISGMNPLTEENSLPAIAAN